MRREGILESRAVSKTILLIHFMWPGYGELLPVCYCIQIKQENNRLKSKSLCNLRFIHNFPIPTYVFVFGCLSHQPLKSAKRMISMTSNVMALFITDTICKQEG